jgi:Mg/Co/Ni transporter MgtE
MTTLQITLPDGLAADAERAGLLSSDSIEELLRERLKERRRQELFAAMDRMAAVETPDYMSPEELAEEIEAMRAEQRVRAAS